MFWEFYNMFPVDGEVGRFILPTSEVVSSRSFTFGLEDRGNQRFHNGVYLKLQKGLPTQAAQGGSRIPRDHHVVRARLSHSR